MCACVLYKGVAICAVCGFEIDAHVLCLHHFLQLFRTVTEVTKLKQLITVKEAWIPASMPNRVSVNACVPSALPASGRS